MTDRKHTKKRDEKAARGTQAEGPAPQAEAEPQVELAEASGPAPGEGPTTAEGGAELAKVAAERDEYLDHLRRLQAEFDNYRKRVRRDSEELRLRAAETVVESLLPVMDNMGRALEAAEKHEESTLIAGLELVAGQLRGTLSGHGLSEVPVEPGSTFDPTVHEAVLTQPAGDFAEGEVLQVLERGYLLHGRLLRPAKVIVAQ